MSILVTNKLHCVKNNTKRLLRSGLDNIWKVCMIVEHFAPPTTWQARKVSTDKSTANPSRSAPPSAKASASVDLGPVAAKSLLEDKERVNS